MALKTPFELNWSCGWPGVTKARSKGGPHRAAVEWH